MRLHNHIPLNDDRVQGDVLAMYKPVAVQAPQARVALQRRARRRRMPTAESGEGAAEAVTRRHVEIGVVVAGRRRLRRATMWIGAAGAAVEEGTDAVGARALEEVVEVGAAEGDDAEGGFEHGEVEKGDEVPFVMLVCERATLGGGGGVYTGDVWICLVGKKIGIANDDDEAREGEEGGTADRISERHHFFFPFLRLRDGTLYQYPKTNTTVVCTFLFRPICSFHITGMGMSRTVKSNTKLITAIASYSCSTFKQVPGTSGFTYFSTGWQLTKGRIMRTIPQTVTMVPRTQSCHRNERLTWKRRA